MKLRPNDRLSTIMTMNPKTIAKDGKLSEVWKLMSENNIHHVPVVSGKKLCGTISYTDLMRINFADSFGEKTDQREIYAWLDATLSIDQVMREDIEIISETATIMDAVKKLAEGKFHGLPIVDKEGDLCAMVTTTDILRWVAAG